MLFRFCNASKPKKIIHSSIPSTKRTLSDQDSFVYTNVPASCQKTIVSFCFASYITFLPDWRLPRFPVVFVDASFVNETLLKRV